MKQQENNRTLEQELRALERTGIQIARAQLKTNICSQFPDYRLWIREYIVNAFDAQARCCRVCGSEDAQTITIVVADDGLGMDRQGIEAFMSKFQSLKHRTTDAVGRFGIGSFSVAAIPGQCGFFMLTSTGQETWRIATGNLLEDRPITVEKITPVQPRGTSFNITFSRERTTLVNELQQLQLLARTYLYYLPINIYFDYPQPCSLGPESIAGWIPGNWTQDPAEQFPKRFCFTLDKHAFDVVLAVGPERQQLYQNQVLITENRKDHNLLCLDLQEKTVVVSNLGIRVESPQFELPLGRHCLSDTEVLKPLARHLRERILPQYLDELASVYESSSTAEFMLRPSEIEDMLSSWMATAPGPIPERFRKVSIFRSYNGKRLSYGELCQAITQHDALFLEDPSGNGLDYEVFDAPVLSKNQPAKGLALINAHFGTHLIDLGVTDLVQEAPARARPPLSAQQQRFHSMLGFSQNALLHYKRQRESSPGSNSPSDGSQELLKLPSRVLDQIRGEALKACRDLEDIQWTVGHLVGRDGKTPSQSALYLCKGNRVVLNLHHPDIIKLVNLCETVPNLAGHFATAMCLSTQGRNTILQHIAPETREELIYLDAIGRCGRADTPVNAARDDKPDGTSDAMTFKDFLRHVTESGFKF